MVFETLLWLGIGVGAGGLTFLIGLGSTLFGYRSARNGYVAAFGDATPVDALADADGSTVARLEGTVTDVPDPVETARGEAVGVYRLKAVLKNYRNLGKKRRHYKELLGDTTRIDGVELAVDPGRRCRLTAPDQATDGWGTTQQAKNETGYLITEQHYVSRDWTDRTAYTDQSAVPDEVLAYLDDQGGDGDFDLDRFGVRSLTVAEDVADVGDTIRVVGPVEPGGAVTDARAARRAAADGRGATPVLALTDGCTVTTDSWWALALAELKTALVKLPAGLVFLATTVVVVYFSLRNAGLV